MFHKDGIVVKFTDKNGNFIGRMSGFRNGNTVYFNQLRSIHDKTDSTDKRVKDDTDHLRECAEAYAKKLIEDTKDSDEPIDDVLITEGYGYINCDYLPVVNKPSPHPMNTESPDYQEFINDSELAIWNAKGGFTTDYSGGSRVFLLATNYQNNIDLDGPKSYDAKAMYDRPRRAATTFTNMELHADEIMKKLNDINARAIYYGDKKKREEHKQQFKLIEKVDDLEYAVIGEDFYIVIDKDGNKREFCLPYDKRSKEELIKYQAIITETFSNGNTQKR